MKMFHGKVNFGSHFEEKSALTVYSSVRIFADNLI